jgi:hypothetical protein
MRIAPIGVIGSVLLLAGCSTAPPANETVSFYRVQLVCPAAPQIGCGSAAKPLLLELERQPGVAEAWLNRAGTILAIVREPGTRVTRPSPAIGGTSYTSPQLEPLSGSAAANALADFRSRTNWYRAAAVDRLSEEEAEIIAARLIRRTQAKATLPKDTAAALQRLMAETTARRFIDPENNPREKLEVAARARAKELLNEQQLAAFEQAYAAGFRPLPNEP